VSTASVISFTGMSNWRFTVLLYQFTMFLSR
jgi:hypothetical protein